jgi:hypothetical protein
MSTGMPLPKARTSASSIYAEAQSAYADYQLYERRKTELDAFHAQLAKRVKTATRGVFASQDKLILERESYRLKQQDFQKTLNQVQQVSQKLGRLELDFEKFKPHTKILGRIQLFERRKMHISNYKSLAGGLFVQMKRTFDQIAPLLMDFDKMAKPQEEIKIRHTQTAVSWFSCCGKRNVPVQNIDVGAKKSCFNWD